jgi:hypothetical protein
MSFSAAGLIVNQENCNPLTPRAKCAQAIYYTNDTLAVVAGADYFNAAAEKLPLGSTIRAVADLDGTPATQTYLVSANDGSTVTLTEEKIA